MIVKDRSLPHPVLTSFRDDVVPNEFEASFSISNDADTYYLDATLSYANATLARLVAEGKASHAVHIECKQNYFRTLQRFSTPLHRITLSANEVVGPIELSTFIVATAPISGYRIAGAHSDYGGSAFEIEPGDILAIAQTQVFDAYVDYDPLSSVSSILTLQRSESEAEGPLRVDTTGSKIIATLSQSDYERYRELKPDPSLAPLLANQVVIPALFQAFAELRQLSADDFEQEVGDKRWIRSVKHKLESMQLDLHDENVPLLELVQSLLQLPLRRTLEGLIKLDSTGGAD